MLKTLVEKFGISELKIENVKSFTQSSTKFFGSSIFNVGSCLTFIPFLTLGMVRRIYKKMCILQINFGSILPVYFKYT